MPVHTFRLFQQWKAYRQRVMAAQVSKIQEIETRRAFYAGAHATISLVKNMPDFPDEDDGVRYLQSIMEECDEFNEKIKRGEA